MARKKSGEKAPVDQETIDRCVAKTVAEGDIVNFRFLFFPYSPLRDDSSEDITTTKYAYLVPEPDEEDGGAYREALRKARERDVQAHVRAQLEKDGPAQLHADLVLLLADNAVRLEKYAAAAQAYELLRIREKMRETILDEADAALDAGDITRAVRGYAVASGLTYNYASFPEPLPAVPDYQTKSLMLHAVYPRRPEDSVAIQTPEAHTATALNYLLRDNTLPTRLAERPLDTRIAFLAAFVRAMDPEWDTFAERYKEACGVVDSLSDRLRQRDAAAGDGESLATEIDQQQGDEVFLEIPALLLGRSIEKGEWWQYLKELAYLHPAAPLFVTRQFVTKQLEIIMPRYVKDSPVVHALGLHAS